MLRITYNEETERYELGTNSLTCGVSFYLLINSKWQSARIEASNGRYYAIVFPNNEKPFKYDLDQADYGSWNSYELQRDEIENIIDNIE